MRTYRASSLGSCTRAQIALQLGMSEIGTSDRMQALYDRGNDHEVECLAAMEAEGWFFYEPGEYLPEITADNGQHFLTLEVAGARVTCHPDAIGRPDPSTDKVVEIKAPYSWAKLERAVKTGDWSDPLMHRYAWQLSVEMIGTGLEAVVACLWPNVQDCSVCGDTYAFPNHVCEKPACKAAGREMRPIWDDGQVRTFGIEVPPFDADEIAERVAEMEHWVQAGEVPELCSQADFPCPVAYLHDKREVVEDEVLANLIGAYAAWKDVEADAKAHMKETREAIDAHLGLNDTLTTEAGTATRVPDSMVTDWRATAEKLAEELSEYQGPNPLEYHKVTKRRAGYINVTPKVDGASE